MKISIDDVRKVVGLLLSHLEETEGDLVNVEQDFYWHVPTDGRYDSYSPPSLSVGQLSDDIEQLRGLLDGSKEPLGSDLMWLAQVLRAIGESSKG